MKLRVVWWIPIAGVWIAHASGFLQQVGPIFDSVDKIIGTVTDLRKLQKTVTIKPVVHQTKADNHERNRLHAVAGRPTAANH